MVRAVTARDESYFSNRRQFVVLNNKSSTYKIKPPGNYFWPFFYINNHFEVIFTYSQTKRPNCFITATSSLS